MRRNWLTILLFALALAIQAFAPAAAHVATQAGATSVVEEICLKDAGSTQPMQTPGHLKVHGLCLFCQSYCDGVAPLAARAVHIGAAPVQWTALSWATASRAPLTFYRDYSRQARAPPSAL